MNENEVAVANSDFSKRIDKLRFLYAHPRPDGVLATAGGSRAT